MLTPRVRELNLTGRDSDMKEYAEKRGFLRMPIDCTLAYGLPGEPKSSEGHVINLSSQGILFTSEHAAEINTKIEILLTPSNPVTQPMEARVIVTRIAHNSPVYEIACERRENS